MAFPLKFRDERGKLRTFRWERYPMVVVLPLEETAWSSDPVPVTMAMPRVVYCGPPAPLPERSRSADGRSYVCCRCSIAFRTEELRDEHERKAGHQWLSH